MLKRFFSLMLMIAFGFNLSLVDCSQANDSLNTPSLEEVYSGNSLIAEKETLKILNRNDAIKLLMNKENLSYDEANKLLKVKANDLFSRTDYIQRTKSYHAGNNTYVEIGALLEVHKAMGGRAIISSTKSMWTAITGNNDSTFTENYIADLTDLTKLYPVSSVRIKARGQVVHAISSLLNISIGKELKKLGFSVSGSAEKTTYYEKTIDLDYTIEARDLV